MNYDSFQDKHLASYFKQRAVQKNLYRFRQAERFENLPTFYKNLSSQFNDRGDSTSPSNCLCIGSGTQCYFCQSKSRKTDLVDSLRPPERTKGRLSLNEYLGRADSLMPHRPTSSHSSNSRASSRQSQLRSNSASLDSRKRLNLELGCSSITKRTTSGHPEDSHGRPVSATSRADDIPPAAVAVTRSPKQQAAIQKQPLSPYMDRSSSSSYRRPQMVSVNNSTQTKKHVTFDEKQAPKRASSALPSSRRYVVSVPVSPVPPAQSTSAKATPTKALSSAPSDHANRAIPPSLELTVQQQIMESLTSTLPPRKPPGAPRGPRQQRPTTATAPAVVRYDPQLQIQQCHPVSISSSTSLRSSGSDAPETFVLLRFTVNQFIKAVVIQRIVRGFLARTRLATKQRAARRIQRVFRRFSARCQRATVTWMFEKQGATWTSTSSFTQYGGIKSPFHTKKLVIQDEFAGEVDLHNDVLTHLSNQLTLLLSEPPKRIDVLNAELTTRKVLQMEFLVVGNEQIARRQLEKEQERFFAAARVEHQNVLRAWRYSKVLLLQWHRAQESIQTQYQKLTELLRFQLQEDVFKTEETTSRFDITLDAHDSIRWALDQTVEEILILLHREEEMEYETILREMEFQEAMLNESENERERFYHEHYLASLLITTEERRAWDSMERVLSEHKNLPRSVAEHAIHGSLLARAEDSARTEILATEFNDFLFLFDEIPIPQFLVEFD